jgi:hypothetical protein
MIKLSKRFVIPFLVGCIICAGALHSGAAEEPERKWTSYMKDRGANVEYLYDKEELTKPSKNLMQVWRKRVFPAGATQKEIVTLDEIDCHQARYRALRLRVTYWDGTVKAWDKVNPWAKVYANSPEEYLMDEHCQETGPENADKSVGSEKKVP